MSMQNTKFKLPVKRKIQPRESPFGESSGSNERITPTSDISYADLVTDPTRMRGQPLACHTAVHYGWELGRMLNMTTPGPEVKYISPEPGPNSNPRYHVFVRRNGQSVHALDTYTKRGTEVPVDENIPIKDVVEKIQSRQLKDFLKGNLNWDLTWPRIRERLLAKLEDPDARLLVRTQTTRQFEIEPAAHTGFVAVHDLRNIPERKGANKPQYLLSFRQLTEKHEFNNLVHWYASAFDRIRAAVHRAIPTKTDRLHVNAGSRPRGDDRILITMGSPYTWWIQDAFTRRTLYLEECDAVDLAFDIGEWFVDGSYIHDFGDEDFDIVRGSLSWWTINTNDYDPDPLYEMQTTLPSAGLVDGEANGIEEYGVGDLNPSSWMDDHIKPDSGSDSGEQFELYGFLDEIFPRRSPRPYTLGPGVLSSPVERSRPMEMTDDLESVPELCDVSSSSQGGDYDCIGDDVLCTNPQDIDPGEYYSGPNDEFEVPSSREKGEFILHPSTLLSMVVKLSATLLASKTSSALYRTQSSLKFSSTTPRLAPWWTPDP
ncbi:hypothetical protein M407DRAFT_34986 [Tulasnella calospora MUT 4182]|uniref:Uncharacterized protein n=1 Tax=Tulasnella calospora MUT 4182 TaxID=1051891 RepID=A0A0C3Q0G7_9AGAM|nr:hypothetical protein M407DRAFT_34986 [Tulasnella calospora MUT 4182]